MKILHCADLHLDTPFHRRSPEQVSYLRGQLLGVPEKLSRVCREQGCQLMLLAGDLFDGSASRESLDALRNALEDAAVPVFISPGNHDFCHAQSPYLTESWPGNVHIFTRPEIQSLCIPGLDCRVYGAGYRAMDCPGLLEGFLASGEERYHIALLHADPTQVTSSYCPVTRQQIQDSGLHYLALGHIHRTGQVTAGETLCAWPGCPMARGFDEPGEKGVLLVTLEHTAKATFLPLDTPRFYELEAAPEDIPQVLPPVGSRDFFRVTLTGGSSQPEAQIRKLYPQFPNLILRDRRSPVRSPWERAGEDSLEGVYFSLLREAVSQAQGDTRQALELAAEISRQILDGQEVCLP